jgi:hypothetical protein
MPGLTIHTDPAVVTAAAHGATTSSSPQAISNHTSVTPRTSSPTRPPVSPITPTFGPTQIPGASSVGSNIPEFALGRPIFTHAQADQVGIAPPPAEPIAFDDNPDVLALKSAISILQIQRARATTDMHALRRAKDAALADPSAFVADLAAGRVGVEPDPLLFPRVDGTPSDSDGDDDENKDGSSEPEGTKTEGGCTPSTSTPASPQKSRRHSGQKRKGKQKSTAARTTTSTAPGGSSAWSKLPKPQNVVRCPPINWAQYGVVGESLDKLHAEQVAAPSPGAPIVLGPGGTYEFKGGDGLSPGEPARRLVGIAAPYTPGKDKVEKKAKGARR